MPLYSKTSIFPVFLLYQPLVRDGTSSCCVTWICSPWRVVFTVQRTPFWSNSRSPLVYASKFRAAHAGAERTPASAAYTANFDVFIFSHLQLALKYPSCPLFPMENTVLPKALSKPFISSAAFWHA